MNNYPENKPDWFKKHEEYEEQNFAERPTKDEMKGIVKAAIEEYFLSTGKTWKGYLLGFALVVGAITVIFGGLKSILGWLGFTYLR